MCLTFKHQTPFLIKGSEIETPIIFPSVKCNMRLKRALPSSYTAVTQEYNTYLVDSFLKQ